MTNTATRLWVAAFVLLVFVSGLSIGLAVSARLGAGDHGNRFRGPGRTGFRPGPPGLVSERIIGRLASEPDFTEDQRERLEALRHPLQLPVHQRGVAPEDGVAVEVGEQEGPGAEERRQPEEHSVDSQQTASRQPLRWRGGDLVGAMTVRRADRGRQRGDHSESLHDNALNASWH